MSNLIPVEFKKQRVLTTEQLAEVYEVDPIRIQQGFIRNKDKFETGKHYFRLVGEELKEFKAYYLKDSNLKYASELILWTERGANRHCKILDTDKAWEQFDNLEETYFRVKETTPKLDALSPQLQLLINMELKQKQLENSIQEAKQDVQAIRDVVEIRPSNSWRGETNRIMTKICFKIKDYSKPKEEAYKALNERARVDLKIRLKNMRARLALQGIAKSKLNELNYLDVIEADKKLIEIYTAIVKEMAIKYKVA